MNPNSFLVCKCGKVQKLTMRILRVCALMSIFLLVGCSEQLDVTKSELKTRTPLPLVNENLELTATQTTTPTPKIKLTSKYDLDIMLDVTQSLLDLTFPTKVEGLRMTRLGLVILLILFPHYPFIHCDEGCTI